jgi:hypothetical protein
MIHFTDNELGGQAMIWDGPYGLIKAAQEINNGPEPYLSKVNVNFPGRKGKSWNDLEGFFHSPWVEALARVQYVQDAIRASGMPEPKSVKRKPYINETAGEVDIDRAMKGDPEYFRSFRRQSTKSPTSIALVTNLDSPASVNPSGLFFRSTACIAATDILEELGFSVEIWVWCRGDNVFKKPNHRQFTAIRLKKQGEQCDKAALVETLSAWYTEYAIVGSIPACGVETNDESYGDVVRANTYPTSIDDCGIGEWKKYLDIEQGVTAIPVPMVWGTWGGNLDSTIVATRFIMDTVIALQN